MEGWEGLADVPWHALGAGFGPSVDEGPCLPSRSGRKWGVEAERMFGGGRWHAWGESEP